MCPAHPVAVAGVWARAVQAETSTVQVLMAAPALAVEARDFFRKRATVQSVVAVVMAALRFSR